MFVTFSVEKDDRGPLFDGRADKAVHDYVQDWERSVARRARDRWVSLLKSTIRNPTPHYWNQIDAIPAGGGWKVWDRMVVYGPWLEGTGSRNRTSRFKGYWNFRKMSTEMNLTAQAIGEQRLALYLPRMN
jgi:hypothetical protein